MNKKSRSIVCLFFMFFILVTVSKAADYVIIPAMAFNSDASIEEFFKAEESYKSYIYVTKKGQIAYAPVYFPSDARGKNVKRMSALVFDDSATGYLVVHLRKVDLRTGNYYSVFSINSNDEGRSSTEKLLHDRTGTNKRIDNSRYGWYLLVYFWGSYVDEEIRLYEVRIKY